MRAFVALFAGLMVLVPLGCSRGAAPVQRAGPQRRALNGYALYDENADGEKLVQQALTQAKAEKKRVLLVFGGNWCKWCHALDNLMHDDAAIKAVVDKSFVVVHVDSDNNAKLNERYGNPFAQGFPVLLVLDGDGTLLHTQESGVLEKEDKSVGHDPDRVIAFLKQWQS